MVRFEAENALTEDLPEQFFIQRHRPRAMSATHIHGHIEINYLEGCSMTYLTAGGTVAVPPNRVVVFWGQLPHRVVEVNGDGMETAVYVPFGDMVRWPLPERFSRVLMNGAFLYARQSDPLDAGLFNRWFEDARSGDKALLAITFDEVQQRLRRFVHAGWEERLADGDSRARMPMRSLWRVEAMTRFIADRYTQSINVDDVAGHAGVSGAYAMALFSKTMGIPIGRYIARLRLGHAQALLVDTDAAVTAIAMDSGFRSISRFYEAFSEEFGTTPHAYRRAARQRIGQRDL